MPDYIIQILRKTANQYGLAVVHKKAGKADDHYSFSKYVEGHLVTFRIQHNTLEGLGKEETDKMLLNFIETLGIKK